VCYYGSYVLALSQNEIRLLQGTRYSVGQVDLVEVPENLADILKWDDPEKRLQWDTRTDSKVDGRAAIFHGHGVASADDPKDYILRYFHSVDEGLSQLLADEQAPMVLDGVEYLLPIYQKANTYRRLMDEGISGNPEELSAKELHEHAWTIVQPLFQREQQEAEAQYQQLAGADSHLASSVVQAVVSAAYHGRVASLFVGLGQHQWGTFDPATNAVYTREEARPGNEDLLDFAAVHTYLNGCEVYAVEPQKVPDDAPLAAVFRY
jgi:hypothetical protein